VDGSTASTTSINASDSPRLVRSQSDADVLRLKWTGSAPALGDPAEVLDGIAGRFRFIEGLPDGSRAGLRRPQIGAVHAVLGYWTTAPLQPATVWSASPAPSADRGWSMCLIIAVGLNK
jgi:hypothetical protein